ncbi:MAG: RNA polymerase sigma factor SigZ [Anaerolineaceae bacterium]
MQQENELAQKQTLEVIWEGMSARIRKFILMRVEDSATAEDLLQEVFVRVHQNMSKLKNSERLESWIYKITRHVIIDHYRSRRIDLEIPETLLDPINLFVEPDAASELAGSIREMIDSLPEPYRQALLMTEYEELDQKALAERVGISLSGAKSRIQRARKKIKDSLLNCCHFEFDHYGRVIDYWDGCCCCVSSTN